MRVLLLVLLASLLLVGCSKSSADEDQAGASSKVTAKDLEPSVEARRFFVDPNCVAWTEGFPLDELKKLTEELYSAGSPKVLFAGAEEIDGKKVSAWFVAELPKEQGARQRCIDVWNKTFKDSDFEADPKADYLDFAMD